VSGDHLAPLSDGAPYSVRSIALICKDNPAVAQTLKTLANTLEKRGVRVLIENNAALLLPAVPDSWQVCDFEHIGETADIAIVLGGDGTMLRAARSLVRWQKPMLGVNQGKLGFMTDIAHHHIGECVDALLEGSCVLEYRQLLTAEIHRANQAPDKQLALNDVVLDKGALGRLIEFAVYIDQEHIYTARGDGLIAATPTGSTAYALSAGGPILSPGLSGILLVPLYPHSLTNRPLIVRDQAEIEVVVVQGDDSRAHLDGQPGNSLSAGDRIKIRRAEQDICFLHPPRYSYYAMLREKLHWGAAAPRQL